MIRRRFGAGDGGTVRGSRHRGGFTLIELLAASIVMAMLMVVLLHFSRASARQVRRAESVRQSRPAVGLASRQIVRDLQSADGMAAAGGGVTLYGPLASSPNSGHGLQQLARVTYAVRRIGGKPVLIRSEQPIRGRAFQRIVWVAAGGLTVRSAGEADRKFDAEETGGLLPLPAALQVELTSADGSVIWSGRVRHHREVR